LDFGADFEAEFRDFALNSGFHSGSAPGPSLTPNPPNPQNLSAAEGPNYVSAGAAPSRLPQRHFCAVCGFPSGYTCVTCGARYCCTRCLGTHQDTRYGGSPKWGKNRKKWEKT
ncbi:zinc finger HIT domain-containing protein 1, partial [Passer montanus]|uniref:zinc finger HIT domain-containing protein 1 n=1 Tax=Passer montanus TaxID=9160 RepID=UPI0019609032